MAIVVKYNVLDIETKQVFPNLMAQEITEHFKISRRYVTKCAKDNIVARGRFKIEVVAKKTNNDEKGNHLTLLDLKDWDKIRKPINKALSNSGKSIKLICPDLGE